MKKNVIGRRIAVDLLKEAHTKHNVQMANDGTQKNRSGNRRSRWRRRRRRRKKWRGLISSADDTYKQESG